MRVLFHPEFPRDIRNFELRYVHVSQGLSVRFRREIDEAIETIKKSPSSAGHFLGMYSRQISELRRRNLRGFPFFVLYAVIGDQLIFGSIIPSRSDPLTW